MILLNPRLTRSGSGAKTCFLNITCPRGLKFGSQRSEDVPEQSTESGQLASKNNCAYFRVFAGIRVADIFRAFRNVTVLRIIFRTLH
jgi:hypothetical protein